MTAVSSSTETQPKKDKWEDPDEYRMSVGEHLEELRHRMILGLSVFFVAFLVLFYFGDQVAAYFCRPLLLALKARNLPTYMYDQELGGSFMVSLQMSLISAAAIAGPWMVYQLWLFIAAGLYPHERKYVTRVTPLSILLTITGLLFVYFVVLPFTIGFFLDWTTTMKLPEMGGNPTITKLEPPPFNVPIYYGDPAVSAVKNGDMWFNEVTGKLNLVVNGAIRSIPFAPTSLVVPQYNLKDYVNLVVMMLLVFGVAFQLPLVVAAVVKVGIVEADQLRSARKMVYFIMLIAASVITPGDVITATLALVGPLILLYEFGIVLGTWGDKVQVEPEEQ